MLQPFQYAWLKIASSALSDLNIEITFLIMGANDSMIGQHLFLTTAFMPTTATSYNRKTGIEVLDMGSAAQTNTNPIRIL